MSYDSFLAEWGGKYVDVDGAYGPQCADLILKYADELGLPRFWGNAADAANQYPPGWIHVSVPQRGDVVVFARTAANGYYGHIGIYDRPGYIFSQNYYPDKRSVIQPILSGDSIIAILRPTTLGGNINTVPQERLDREIAASRKARRFLASALYSLLLGRPATDKENTARQDQDPDVMYKEIAGSEEAKKFNPTGLGASKNTQDGKLKQALLDFLNKWK